MPAAILWAFVTGFPEALFNFTEWETETEGPGVGVGMGAGRCWNRVPTLPAPHFLRVCLCVCMYVCLLAFLLFWLLLVLGIKPRSSSC